MPEMLYEHQNNFCFDNLAKAAIVEVDEVQLPPLTVHDDNDPLTTTKVMVRFGPFIGISYRFPDHEDLSVDELKSLALEDLAKGVREFVGALVDHEILV